VNANSYWLPWLEKNQRQIMIERIENVVLIELRKRHWGTEASGKSPGGITRIYITDIRGLFLACGIIRYTLKDFNTTIYYRGQNKDWQLRPRLYRGIRNDNERKVVEDWITDVLYNIRDKFDHNGTDDEREALAQHYGLYTRWVDVVDHVQTAAWFAYYQANPPRDNETSDGCAYDDDIGYINVLGIPNDSDLFMSIDLRLKPANWLRPHVQQAFVIRSKNPGKSLGNLHHINIITFIVPRFLLKRWSNYDVIEPYYLFPNYHQDLGLKWWKECEEYLKSIGKTTIPPIL
jgi:hypothetical protein